VSNRDKKPFIINDAYPSAASECKSLQKEKDVIILKVMGVNDGKQKHRFEICEHIPAFVETVSRPEINAFTTKDDFERCPLVIRWKKRKNFYRFSVSKNKEYGVFTGRNLLMAEYNKGKSFYVVGQLRGTPKWLPNWEIDEEIS